jgi:hypothetical protein
MTDVFRTHHPRMATCGRKVITDRRRQFAGWSKQPSSAQKRSSWAGPFSHVLVRQPSLDLTGCRSIACKQTFECGRHLRALLHSMGSGLSGRVQPKRHPQTIPRSKQFSASFEIPLTVFPTSALLPILNASGAGSPESEPISLFCHLCGLNSRDE